MLYEYAVEPQAIGADWQTFRYVIEKFGFDKGRLISQYPKHWYRDVYDAGLHLSDLQKKRIEEALSQARKNKVVRRVREFNPELGSWLDNATAEHARIPFRAIIASANPAASEFILKPDELDEQLPLLHVPVDCAVARDAVALADAMKGLLQYSSTILFVDPFFDPFNNRYKSTLRECLRIVAGSNAGATCEVHYRYHDNKPAPAELEPELHNLFAGIIPDDLKLSIFCWKEIENGADFHARYLLTEKGGISIDAGLSAEGAHQTTDMHLMSYEFTQGRLGMFSRSATAYELVEPVLRISANGDVERI